MTEKHMTVTMPMSEYREMQKELEELRARLRDYWGKAQKYTDNLFHGIPLTGSLVDAEGRDWVVRRFRDGSVDMYR